MKIQFEKQDLEQILYDSFCNGGLSELYYCGIAVDWESNPNAMNYKNARKRLKEKQNETTIICIEDVYIEILKNGDAIIFTDNEGGDDELIELRLDDALNNINSISDKAKIELAKLLDEDDCSTDAWDCFNAIQYALYKEVIYG